MTDRKTVIRHLKMIQTWADHAMKRGRCFFTPLHVEKISKWTADALELIKAGNYPDEEGGREDDLTDFLETMKYIK